MRPLDLRAQENIVGNRHLSSAGIYTLEVVRDSDAELGALYELSLILTSP